MVHLLMDFDEALSVSLTRSFEIETTKLFSRTKPYYVFENVNYAEIRGKRALNNTMKNQIFSFSFSFFFFFF